MPHIFIILSVVNLILAAFYQDTVFLIMATIYITGYGIICEIKERTTK
jgi:hypothetical protein